MTNQAAGIKHLGKIHESLTCPRGLSDIADYKRMLATCEANGAKPIQRYCPIEKTDMRQYKPFDLEVYKRLTSEQIERICPSGITT